MSRLILPNHIKGLPTTGQTTSYADYDDGYYEMGALGNSANRFAQFVGPNGAHLVYDVVTGLTWPRVPFDDADHGPDFADTYTYANALAACQNPQCTGGDLGGYDDWRMPNINELMSLLDWGDNDGGYDADIWDESGITLKYGFGNHGMEGFYWTSTKCWIGAYHYQVRFNAYDGDAAYGAADSGATATVICVRGGKRNG